MIHALLLYVLLILTAVVFPFSMIAGILFTCISLAYTVLILKRKQQNRQKKEFAVAVLIAIVISILFVNLFSTTTDANNKEPKIQTIEIKALGERSGLSKGTEVWIKNLVVDGTPQNLIGLDTHSRDWEIKYDRLFTSKKTEITWTGPMRDRFDIQLLSHSWSGKVQIYKNGQILDTLDLYSPNEQIISLEFHNKVNVVSKLLHYILILISSASFLYMFLVFFKMPNMHVYYALVYSLFPFLLWSVFALANSPGIMSADSLFQWSQVHSGFFNDHQPIVHTFLIYLLTRLYDSPSILMWLQILTMSFVVGLGATQLLKLKLSKYWILAYICIISFLPIHALMSVTLWKDTLYGTVFMAMIIWIFHAYENGGQNLTRKSGYAITTILLVCLASLRHNGLLAAILFVLVLFFLLPMKRKSIIISTTFGITVLIAIKVIIHSMFPVTPSPKWLPLALPVHNLASVVHEGHNLEEKNQLLLNRFLPKDEWISSYNPYTTDSLFFNPKMNKDLLEEHRSSLIKTWIDEFFNHPTVMIKDWAKLTSLLWKIDQPKDGYLYAVHRGIDKNSFGLTQNSILPMHVKTSIDTFIQKSLDTRLISSFLWRPAGYLYLLCISLIILFTLNRKRYAFIALPLLAEIASLFFTLPAQDVRYTYTLYWAAPFFSLLAIHALYRKFKPLKEIL